LKEDLNLSVIHVLEEPPDNWDGETGFIDVDLMERHLPDQDADWEYFICGPEPMIDAVEEALDKREIPIEHVHAERYQLN
jgi:predicted ferric reductase